MSLIFGPPNDIGGKSALFDVIAPDEAPDVVTPFMNLFSGSNVNFPSWNTSFCLFGDFSVSLPSVGVLGYCRSKIFSVFSLAA